jgi:hypothetical protein
MLKPDLHITFSVVEVLDPGQAIEAATDSCRERKQVITSFMVWVGDRRKETRA